MLGINIYMKGRQVVRVTTRVSGNGTLMMPLMDRQWTLYFTATNIGSLDTITLTKMRLLSLAWTMMAQTKKRRVGEREREGTIKRILSNNKKNIFDSSVHHCGNLNKHWCSSICLVVPDRTKQTGARTHHSNTRLLLQHLDNSAFVPQTTTTTAATTTTSKLVTCTRRTTIYL